MIAGTLFFLCAFVLTMHFFGFGETAGHKTKEDASNPASAQEETDSLMPDLEQYEGFLPVCLQGDSLKDMPVDLNLYLDGTGKGYFFLPSFLSLDNLRFQFDETSYNIRIADETVRPLDCPSAFEPNREYSASITSSPEGSSDSGTFTLTFMQSQNLPSVFISTATGSLDYMHASREHKEPGSFACILPDGQLDSQGALSSVRCHGNFSFLAVDKKSYQIFFEENTSVLSMGAASRYILQANALDITRMRNGIVYSYCQDVGIPYSVDTSYVDLYFNGEYAGNYLLCERVEIGKDRIDLSPDGYLIEKMISERIKPDDCAFQVAGMNWFITRDPSTITEEELLKVSEYMNHVETLISQCDTKEKYTELSEYIDTDSFVDMYLVNAITNDIDANIASTFYYLHDNGNGLKLYAGPVWDYDNSFGRNSRGYDVELNAYPSGLCEELFRIPYFRDQAADRFHTAYDPLMEQYLTDTIPQLQAKLQPSVTMDLCRWKSKGYLPVSNLGREDSILYLYDYIRMRLDYIRDYISHPQTYHYVRFVNSTPNADYRDIELWIRDGEPITDDVMEEMEDRFECTGFSFGNGKPYSNTGPVFSDMTLYSSN